MYFFLHFPEELTKSFDQHVSVWLTGVFVLLVVWIMSTQVQHVSKNQLQMFVEEGKGKYQTF